MASVEELITRFNKHFGDEILGYGVKLPEYQALKFTSPVPNRMLYGGLPRGRCIEFYGDEGSGKTTTALDIIANAQKTFQAEWEVECEELANSKGKTAASSLEALKERGPKRVLYADVENTLDEEWAKTLGVDTDAMVVIKPTAQTAEQMLEMIYQFMLTGEIGLVVLDSIAAMVSSQAFETSIEQRTYAGIAMPMTEFSNKAEMACAQTGCTLIGINQLRDNLGAMHGPKTKTPGGRAWRFICSVRIQFQKGNYIDDLGKEVKKSEPNISGNMIRMSIVKTKVCRPDRRTGEYTLHYERGVLDKADMLTVGLIQGFIVQRSSMFDFIEPHTGEVVDTAKGMKGALEYLADNDELMAKYNLFIQEVV